MTIESAVDRELGMNLLSYIARAIDRGRRYIHTMHWILKHGLSRPKARLWSLIAVSMFALCAQVLVVAVIFLYVSLIEGAGSSTFVSIPEDFLRSYYGLSTFVALLVVFLTLSHITLYRVRMIAINCARDTEIYCGRLALKLSARLPDLSRLAATSKAKNSTLRNLIIRDARYCGMTNRLMALCIPDMMALSVAILGLVVLDGLMTSIILVLGAMVFFFQYPANIKAADATRRWQNLRPQHVKQAQISIERIRLGPSRPQETKKEAVDLYSSASVVGSIESYANRIRAIELGTLATQIGTTLLIASIIFFVGYRALIGESEWALLVTYIALLRVASVSFNSLARYTTSMARLYPQVQEFVNFVNDCESYMYPADLKNRSWVLRVKLASNEDSSSVRPVRYADLERTSLTALVSLDVRHVARPDFAIALSAQVNTSFIADVSCGSHDLVHSEITQGSTTGAVVLIARGRAQVGLLPNMVFGVLDDIKSHDWSILLDDLRSACPGYANDIDDLKNISLDAYTFSENALDGRREVLIQIAAALVRRASIVIIEREALMEIGSRSFEELLMQRLRRDSHVVIWYSVHQVVHTDMPDLSETTVLISAGDIILYAIDLTQDVGRDQLVRTINERSGIGKPAKTTDISADDGDLDLE
jgi:hypothetical protein